MTVGGVWGLGRGVCGGDHHRRTEYYIPFSSQRVRGGEGGRRRGGEEG